MTTDDHPELASAPSQIVQVNDIARLTLGPDTSGALRFGVEYANEDPDGNLDWSWPDGSWVLLTADDVARLRAALFAHGEGSTAPAPRLCVTCFARHVDDHDNTMCDHFVPACAHPLGEYGVCELPEGHELPCAGAGPADLPADTPEPSRCTCKDPDAGRGFEDCPVHDSDLVSATPEGGQPTTADPSELRCPTCDGHVARQKPASEGGQPSDDELLARAENDPISLSDSDVVELASALRRKGERVTELEVLIEGCGCPPPFDQCTHDEPLLGMIARLERKLDEARDHCSHVVTSDAGTSFCDLAEARSHGEVLATGTVAAAHWAETGGSFHLTLRAAFANTKLRPGQDVVVRPVEDQEASDGE